MSSWLLGRPLMLTLWPYLLGLLLVDPGSPLFVKFIFTFAIGAIALRLLLLKHVWLCGFMLLCCVGGGIRFQTQLINVSSAPEVSLSSHHFYVQGLPRYRDSGWSVSGRIVCPGQEDAASECDWPAELFVREGGEIYFPGDTLAVWGLLRTPSFWRNPGTDHAYWRWRRQGQPLRLTSKEGSYIELVQRPGFSWLRPLTQLRHTLRANIINLNLQHEGLLLALMLGDRSQLSDDLEDHFRTLGIAHLMAISGQHVGLVSLLSFAVLRLLLGFLPVLALYCPLQRLAWSLSLIPLWLYVGLAGCPLSAIRAGLLVSLLIISQWFWQRRDFYSTLAGAAWLILLWDPAALWSPGFLLSFVAVGIVGVCYQRFVQESLLQQQTVSLFNRLKNWIFLSIQTSFWVTLLTAPLVAYYFGAVSWHGLWANMLFIPLLSFVVLPLIFMSSLLGWMVTLLWSVTDRALGFWIMAVDWLAQWLWTWVVTPQWFELMIFYSFGVFAWLARSWLRKVLIISGCLLLLVIHHCPSDSASLKVAMLDVGQGEAIVVSLPGGQHFLIDGGGHYIPEAQRQWDAPDIGERVIVPYLRSQGIHHLDGIILTHPHPDHYGGLETVLKNIPVKAFYHNGDRFPDPSFTRLMEQLHQNGIPEYVITTDAPSPKLADPSVQWRWINPISKGAYAGDQSMNDRSIALRINYGETCVLLTGDIEASVETRWIRAGLEPCDLLKVAHHGSRTSTTESFIRHLQPKIAVMSFGKNNPFGFPHQDTLQSLSHGRVMILNTADAGAVRLYSDGKEWVSY